MNERVIVIGGGQSGLATAHALVRRGARPVLLEAGPEATGSWGRYYDSLRLFTPAKLDALPGRPFPGDPTHYPTRDEVTDYLRRYADGIDAEIRTGTRVVSVDRQADGYVVRTERGAEFEAPAVVAATGQFDRPHRPELPGLDGYTGDVLHAADYRRPEELAGRRVLVVGAGNSAVQIAVELALHARVSIASRQPIRYASTTPVPGDSVVWKALALAARVPIGGLFGTGSIPVIDTVGVRAAIEAGHPDRRELPVRADGDTLHWGDGTAETVDTVLLATGYRPALDYLHPLGLSHSRDPGVPEHSGGMSRRYPGLAFVGLEHQRTILSATLCGVGRDAAHVAARLTGGGRRLLGTGGGNR